MPHFLPFEMQSVLSQKITHALADGNHILLHNDLKITLAHPERAERAQQQATLSPVSAGS